MRWQLWICDQPDLCGDLKTPSTQSQYRHAVRADLYVMRRGVGIYSAVIRRFTAQTTDYQRLLSTFAEGLYTEMDFRNEALNMARMQQLLDESDFATQDVVIPPPVMEYTSRRCVATQCFCGFCSPGPSVHTERCYRA